MSPIPRSAGALLAGASAVLIALLTLLPNQDTSRHAWCIVCGEVGGIDLVLNIALFVPLGVGLALLRVRVVTATAIACAGSIAIELLQLTVVTGRSATLSDVLTNTGGAALGFWLAVNLEGLVQPAPRAAARMAIAAGIAWLGIQTMAAFSILPSISGPPHRAQSGRGLAATYESFQGELLTALVDDRELRASDLPRDRPFHEIELHEGSIGEVVAVPTACPEWPAALIHVGDTLYRELFILAALRRDVIFGVRTGAEALRLGPIRYRLPDALGSPQTCAGRGDTTRVSVHYARSVVVLRADVRGRSTLAVQHRPQLSQAWGLFVPFLWYREGSPGERALDVAWVAALLLPVAFWTGIAGANAGRRNVAVSLYVLAICAGFVVVPMAFGVSIPGALDWSAACIASALAWRAGSRVQKKT